ncbi:MAG TPA: hypothetical protein PK299_10395 [Anaerolineales bacterium]|nr:hypothetical protein [Anaerolineales bacterium]
MHTDAGDSAATQAVSHALAFFWLDGLPSPPQRGNTCSSAARRLYYSLFGSDAPSPN